MSFLARLKDARDKIGEKVLVSSDEASARMAICRDCPLLTKIDTCRDCGCFMPAKTRLKGVECPQGKW